MKRSIRFASLLVVLPLLAAVALSGNAQAAVIDTGTSWDTNSTTAAAATAINWSALTWDNGAPNAAGVTAGIDNGGLARTYTLDTSIILKQLQFTNCADITLTSSGGSTITWDSGAVGVQCELGRNRGLATAYSAGRAFTVSGDFILNSDLRVTNWVESRSTTYNATTTGTGKLTLRVVHWGAGNVGTYSIGGTSSNTHTGGTTLTVDQGTINATVNKLGAFGTGVLRLAGNGVINLNLNNYDQTVAGLTSDGTGTKTITNGGANSKSLTLKLADGATTTYAGKLSGSNLGLVIDKATGASGTGIQVLTGANTYTGATDVNAGTLLVSGDNSAATGAVNVTGGTLKIDTTGTINGTSGLTINGPTAEFMYNNSTTAFSQPITFTQGTLSGTGTIGVAVTVPAGGILAPGASIGTLTIGNSLVLANGSVLEFDLDGTNQTVGGGVNDLVTGVTDLTLDGTLNITDVGATFSGVTGTEVWRLFDYTNLLLADNGLTIGTTPPLLPGGLYFAIDTSTAGQVNLKLLPEPATMALLGLGGLGLLLGRKRR